MFTGLIETTAVLKKRIEQQGAAQLSLEPRKKLTVLKRGDSLAVNGVCLTLEEFTPSGNLQFHLLGETLRRTNLGCLPLGATVNIERPLVLNDRLDGHLVTGHIDATAAVRSIRRVAGGDWEYQVALPPKLAPYLVEKGCIAVDGISLTVVSVSAAAFSVHIIPVTRTETALGERKVGDLVNLETDLIAKYVQRQLVHTVANRSVVDMELLRRAGWE